MSIDVEELRSRYAEVLRGLIASRPALSDDHREQTLRFALGRFDEGLGLGEFFATLIKQLPRRTRVLDLGAGDGGVSIGMASRGYRMLASDLHIEQGSYKDVSRGELSIAHLVSDGARLPLRSGSIDVVLFLEVIEHIADARGAAAEIMRVLKPGGFCMVTTPARMRHLFGPDPHFGIKGLMLLPDPLQRRVTIALARRRLGVDLSDAYDVQHIYWTADGVAALFPGPKRVTPLWDRIAASPPSLRDRMWRIVRSFLWDRILIEKA